MTPGSSVPGMKMPAARISSSWFAFGLPAIPSASG